jgi:hypothetical protein
MFLRNNNLYWFISSILRLAFAKTILFMIFGLFVPFMVIAESMDNAILKAVIELQKNGLNRDGKFEMVMEITNINSGKYDKDARIIKSTLYSTLQSEYPNAKIIIEEAALVGVSYKAVLIKGTYQPKGKTINLNLKAIEQTTGELIAKSNISYETETKISEDLIAVLTLEAPELKKEVREAFTKVYRSALLETKKFNLVNSDAIDQVDADEIQEQYSCTREECSIIVAESLNANRVITTTYTKIRDGMFFLTGSLKDIKKGSTINEHAIQHDGNINTLEQSLKKLACELAETCSNFGSIGFVGDTTTEVSRQSKIELITPKYSGNSKSNIAALFLDTIPPKVDVYIGNTKAGTSPYQNMGLQSNQQIELTLRKQGYHDRSLQTILQGGTNDLGTIELKKNTGNLEITSNPSGATVTFTGESVGSTPVTINDYQSGSYLVSLETPFYIPLHNQQIVITDDKTTIKHFELKPNFGTLKLSPTPQDTSTVVYNQKSEIVTQFTGERSEKLTPGSYHMKLTRDGYLPKEFNLTVGLSQVIQLTSEQTTLEQMMGSLIISSEPFKRGADVYVNGEKKGLVPASLTLPVGRREIEIKTDTMEGKQIIDIEHQDSKAITINLELSEKVKRLKKSKTYNKCIIGAFELGFYNNPKGNPDNPKMMKSKGEQAFFFTVGLAFSSLLNSLVTSEDIKECKKRYGIEVSKHDLEQLKYIAVNNDRIALEIAGLKGETVGAYTQLLGCPSSQARKVNDIAKRNHNNIFIKDDNSFTFVWLALNDSIKSDPYLSRSCKNLN